MLRKKRYIFRENGENMFPGTKSLLKGKGHLATKMNMTCFVENEVLNIFSSKKCFPRKQHSSRKKGGGRKFWAGTWPFFLKRSPYVKNEYLSLSKIRLWIFSYQMIFFEKAVFSGETAKNCFGVYLINF